MKKNHNLSLRIATLLLPFLILACGEQKPVLKVYNWANYMDPELIAGFEEQFGCRVFIDTFDSNESMLAKIQSGADDYDVVFPSSYMAAAMEEQGRLLPIDHAKIPNLEHIDPKILEQFALDKEMKYSVPYMQAATGVGYNKTKIPDPVTSWTFFDSEGIQGRVTLLNDKREALGAALKMLGYSLNTGNPEEIEQARDLLIHWKKNAAKFDSETYMSALATGELFGAMGYSGDVFQAQEENADVEFSIPEEGSSVAVDDMVILAAGKQPDLAHAFINFFHDPKNAAKNMETTFYLCPNTACYPLVNEELRTNEAIFIPASVLEKCEVIRELPQDVAALYDQAWDAVLAR